MLGGLDYKSVATAVRRALSGLLDAAGTDGYPLTKLAASLSGASWQPPSLGYNLVGGYLDWTVAGSVLTCAVKTWAGNDPSATTPVFYAVRDATASTGSLTYRPITAALSVSINNTALMGTVNSIAFRLWGVIFNDGGTDRLSLINCVSTVAGAGSGRDVTAIYPLSGWGIASAVLSDNAADNAQVFYANAAVTSKAYTNIGYATWETGLAAAGVWSAAPTRKQLFGPGVPLPGQLIQVQRTDTGGVATTATILPLDDSIPQITEGAQFLSQAITPSSAANVIEVKSQIVGGTAASADLTASALFQDAVANALKASGADTYAGTVFLPIALEHLMLSGVSVATTFKVRAGNTSGATFTFNGRSSARSYGGVMNSYLATMELMG